MMTTAMIKHSFNWHVIPVTLLTIWRWLPEILLATCLGVLLWIGTHDTWQLTTGFWFFGSVVPGFWLGWRNRVRYDQWIVRQDPTNWSNSNQFWDKT